MEDLKQKSTLQESQVFELLFNLATVDNLPTDLRAAYERSLKRYEEEERIEEEHQRKMKEVAEEALNRGRREISLEIARQFKSDGFPVAIIARNTGLSPEEVDQL